MIMRVSLLLASPLMIGASCAPPLATSFPIIRDSANGPLRIDWVRSRENGDGTLVTGRIRQVRGIGAPLGSHLHVTATLANGEQITREARWSSALSRRHRSADFRVVLPTAGNRVGQLHVQYGAPHAAVR